MKLEGKLAIGSSSKSMERTLPMASAGWFVEGGYEGLCSLAATQGSQLSSKMRQLATSRDLRRKVVHNTATV